MTDTTKQAEPMVTTERIDQYGIPEFPAKRVYAAKIFYGNKIEGHITYYHVKPKHIQTVEYVRVDANPAPALSAELKAELIHCLNIGYSAQLMTVANSGMTDYKAGKLAEIRAAITKLTNQECGS